jgi:hypothetical protein
MQLVQRFEKLEMVVTLLTEAFGTNENAIRGKDLDYFFQHVSCVGAREVADGPVPDNHVVLTQREGPGNCVLKMVGNVRSCVAGSRSGDRVGFDIDSVNVFTAQTKKAPREEAISTTDIQEAIAIAQDFGREHSPVEGKGTGPTGPKAHFEDPEALIVKVRRILAQVPLPVFFACEVLAEQREQHSLADATATLDQFPAIGNRLLNIAAKPG